MVVTESPAEPATNATTVAVPRPVAAGARVMHAAAVAGTTSVPQAGAPTRSMRMTLNSIAVGLMTGPLRLVIYGVEGIGKTNTAACAPSPVFVGPEDGLENLSHVARFPEPHNWQDVLDAVRELIAHESPYRTLVIDTVDWIEPLIWQWVCEQGDDRWQPKKHIEDFGYDKGYMKALDQWRILLSLFERLRKTRGMHVILLAHCHVKTWKNPEGDDFDRYMLKVHDKAAGLLKEWSSAVLFANYETFTKGNERTKQFKGISTGERLLYTERAAAYDAKNRFNLPPAIPLDWDALEAAIEAGRLPEPAVLCTSINARLAEHGDAALAGRVRAAVTAAKSDAVRLRRIADHLETTIAQAIAAGANSAEGA